MHENKVLVKRVHPDAILPARKSSKAAAYDLCTIEDFHLSSGEFEVVRTGLIIQPPPGYHTELIIRSSLAYNHQIFLANCVGVIDEDYAGPNDEIKLLLVRFHILGPFRPPVFFKKGQRIAQLLIRKTETFDFVEVDEAPSNITRGGFGSTGSK